jgi:hypothetical protein
MTAIDEHFDSKLEEIKIIVGDVVTKLNQLKTGEKILMTTISKEISEKTGKDFTKIYQILTFFIEGCPGVVRKSGRKGGTYKL